MWVRVPLGNSDIFLSKNGSKNIIKTILLLLNNLLHSLCLSELLETFYEDAAHYWSFDDVNMKDLKTGTPLVAVGDVTRTLGPVNQAIHITSSSHVLFGTVKGVCLVDPSLCSSGLTMALWLKPEYRFRTRLFFPSVSKQLGVLLVSENAEKSVTMFIRGTNHNCKLSVKLPERIWSFISITWSLSDDGSGNLAFYYNDVEKLTKACQSSPQSFGAYQEKMEAVSDSLARYSLDELAIWMQLLSEVRIREIYSIVAGEPGWMLKLRLHTAINRADFVSWCMFIRTKVTKCNCEKITLYFRG